METAATVASPLPALIIVVLVIGFYLLPTIIAYSKKKRDRVAIMALNILAGWFFLIGWIIALVWALKEDR